jgi:oligopeptide transport system substrate-binding protein
MKKTILFFIISFAVAFGCYCAVSFHCSPSQILHLNIAGEPESLDPRKCSSHNAGFLATMLFEGLLQSPLEVDEVRWGVAEGVDISPDCMRYTFHLKEAFWSDGAPLTAHDFEYSWKSTLDPHFPSTDSHLLYPIKNAEAAKKGVLTIADVGVVALDDRTLVVEMERPLAFFLKMVCAIPFSPVPRHIVEGNPQWANEASIVGNGPFKMGAWRHAQEVIVVKNDHYHRADLVKCDAIHVSMLDNEGAALHLFDRGELDLVGGDVLALPVDAIETLKKEKELLKAPYRATKHCAFNTDAYPFHNLNIRRAFALAVNRSLLADEAMYCRDEVALNMIPKMFRGGRNLSYFEDGDVALARVYFQRGLEELHIDSESLEIALRYDQSQINATLAQALQQQWYEAFGVMVNLIGSEPRVHAVAMRGHQFQIGLTQWTLYYEDPLNILERYRSKDLLKNYLQWENEKFAALLDIYTAESSAERREEIVDQMEAIFMSEMPVIPLFHYSRPYLVSERLSGLQVTPLGSFFFTETFLTN